jgi:hypothetical protein
MRVIYAHSHRTAFRVASDVRFQAAGAEEDDRKALEGDYRAAQDANSVSR